MKKYHKSQRHEQLPKKSNQDLPANADDDDDTVNEEEQYKKR